ncbi:hypothetical protein Tco_1416717 [Tanacetum coccineum]
MISQSHLIKDIWLARMMESCLLDLKFKFGILGTDKTKITRKPSKTGKNGLENGRVCKSRKPKSEKSTLSQLSQTTQGQKSKVTNLVPQGPNVPNLKDVIHLDEYSIYTLQREGLILPIPQRECHVVVKKAQEEVGICIEVTQRTSTNVTSMDCHAGNPCELDMIQGWRIVIQSLRESNGRD